MGEPQLLGANVGERVLLHGDPEFNFTKVHEQDLIVCASTWEMILTTLSCIRFRMADKFRLASTLITLYIMVGSDIVTHLRWPLLVLSQSI